MQGFNCSACYTAGRAILKLIVFYKQFVSCWYTLVAYRENVVSRR